MVTGSNGFVKFDLAISRAVHEANWARLQKAQTAFDDGRKPPETVYPLWDKDLQPVLRIQKEDAPDFSDLRAILDRVGKPYNWDLRREYHDAASVVRISERLAQPTSARYSFWSGKKEVGGAIIANVEDNVEEIFAKAHSDVAPIDLKPEDAHSTVEIYKIGLFPEYTDHRLGKYFLPMLLEELFNRESKPSVVYLNTRSTNHGGVIKFYTDMNMNVIHARSFPNDLVEEDGKAAKKGNPSSKGRQNNAGGEPSPGLKYA